MVDDLGAVLTAVGPQLRALRQVAAVTLAELYEVLAVFGRQGERAHLRAKAEGPRGRQAP